MDRRELVKTVALAAAVGVCEGQTAAPLKLPQAKIDVHDKYVDIMLGKQILDRGHRYAGTYATDEGLFYGGTPSGIIDACLTAWVHPQSKHHKSGLLAERMKLAAECHARMQTKDGNFDLPITNFNSPPDTAFIMQQMGLTIGNARRYGFPQLEKWLEPAVMKAGNALVRGGVHTPNHRWVVCSALAAMHKLYGDKRYIARIDQWLAETIDIDAEGQYTERSSIGYNGICNRAFTIAADRLGRPELLAPVRKNLAAMLYLIHADGEVVTEISRRQDLNQRGTMFNSWLGIAYLAWKDRDGVLAGLARSVESQGAGVSAYLSFPQLVDSELPASKPLPDNYEKWMPITGIARVRRGPMSVSILRDRDRFFTFRHGDAVVTGALFSSAFFGKGQFQAPAMTKRDGVYVLEQELSGPYYQPFEPPRKVTTETYDDTRHERRQSEVCQMRYKAGLKEMPEGFELRIEANGTDDVPLTVEIALREGGELTGAEKSERMPDAWILRDGTARYRRGKDQIEIGPWKSAHSYLEVRGASPRLGGPTLFLTAFTPVDAVVRFRKV